MVQVRLADGHDLAVRCIGRGEPVVLLHGFASQSAHWLINVLPLAHRYRFILPDFRGFGRSQRVPITSKDVFEQYADDLHAVVEHFGLEKFALGGISTGALVALTYNQRHGFDRVSRYLHIECSPNTRNDDDWAGGLFSPRQEEFFQRFDDLIEMAHAAGKDTPYWELPLETRQALKNMLGRAAGLAVDRKIGRWLAYMAGIFGEPLLAGPVFPIESWYSYLQVLQAFMRGHDVRDSLSSIKVPTTLMVGNHSRFFPAQGQLHILEHVPHAKLVRFERSGHVPILDEPIRFQREFQRFFSPIAAKAERSCLISRITAVA